MAGEINRDILDEYVKWQQVPLSMYWEHLPYKGEAVVYPSTSRIKAERLRARKRL